MSRSRPRSAAAARFADNPFYVLGVRPTATRMEIERQGQTLLGMLELGLASAATYATPVGVEPRTPEKVRQALAELRDPERRLAHELWARLDPAGGDGDGAVPSDGEDVATPAPWADALAALGWRRR